MNGLLFKTASAALSLILGVGTAQAASVIITGGSPQTIGGWEIAPDLGVTLNVTGVNANQTLVIQNKTATFSSLTPLDVTFIQTSADAVPLVDFATETLTNSSGSNWTGFNFVLAGGASFDGIGDVFAPPIGTGVNYTNVILNSARDMVAYTGTQSNGATADWGSSNTGDDLLIDTNASTSSDSFGSFTLQEAPQGSPVSSEGVALPSAAWQSLAGLLLLGVSFPVRKAMRVRA